MRYMYLLRLFTASFRGEYWNEGKSKDNFSVSVPSKFFQKYDKVSWAIALLSIINSLNKLNHCLLWTYLLLLICLEKYPGERYVGHLFQWTNSTGPVY